ncbi:sugar phosphorylase [Rubripirellula reticaptiva]|uniref:Sucrose phosphorylase n=1 Tax=Rubripirellula reticaptiva TaxID=2528013 RepID=A0A5C6EQH4_9BACT|nr:sugar phosphorylase [Rubripirellula reticaptiva]TWU49856.1 Sucrose phosphorylase [Rubripirellula reticaptiva]
MVSPSSQDDSNVRSQLCQHLRFLYPEANAEELADSVIAIFDDFQPQIPLPLNQLWSEQDCLLITYGDSIVDGDVAPLETLDQFLSQHLQGAVSAVHVLPFCPFSSDDGFAVIDYAQVNSKLGDWSQISSISDRYRLMADIVINHCSSQSQWFQNYCDGVEPGATYFMEASAGDDLSAVVRPRASPLLRPTKTANGLKHVWCTFSHDQVDLDFRNPQVLLEFLKIVRLYLQQGVSIFRLDAIGFLWKESGTSCIHLPQTHEVVRLIRTVTDSFAPGTLLITETNVPNHENLTYFGNRNEAHVIYNFSLAPLLVHALLTGKTEYLKRWMMSMPPAPVGCTYLNFTASHDGIGMRPAEGLLSDEEQLQLVETVRSFGGKVSTRRTEGGGERVYELNVALFDALQGTVAGTDQWQVERFLCSQTVMMGLEGIPAFYIHSLLATGNDLDGVAATDQNRSINRHKWGWSDLQEHLGDDRSVHAQVFRELTRRMQLRRRHAPFHPNATQFTLQLSEPFFAYWRQSTDRSQSIFCVYNMTNQVQELRLSDLNLISTDVWYDAISGLRFDEQTSVLELTPYQSLWITNR